MLEGPRRSVGSPGDLQHRRRGQSRRRNTERRPNPSAERRPVGGDVPVHQPWDQPWAPHTIDIPQGTTLQTQQCRSSSWRSPRAARSTARGFWSSHRHGRSERRFGRTSAPNFALKPALSARAKPWELLGSFQVGFSTKACACGTNLRPHPSSDRTCDMGVQSPVRLCGMGAQSSE